MKLAHWLGLWKVFCKVSCKVLSRVPVARANIASPRTACCVWKLSQPRLCSIRTLAGNCFTGTRERGATTAHPHPHTSSAGVWTEKISTLERKLDLRLTNLDLLFIENVSLLIAASGGILTGWTLELLTEFRETFGKGPCFSIFLFKTFKKMFACPKHPNHGWLKNVSQFNAHSHSYLE